jgi:hypothetical protein
MKRRLGYLGFLGFLGLLGLTGNFAFYGLFNFFGFWALSKQKKDEMLMLNAANAGLNAFKISLVALSLTVAIISVFKTLEAAMISIALVFTAQLLTFIISFNYYEKRGNL